jgi:hypothetical protein
MSLNVPENPEEQEINLTQVFEKIGGLIDIFFIRLFEGFLFLKRNSIVLIILFVLGTGLGYFIDKIRVYYDNEIIVMPNFSSNDYLYAKVTLLNSKINENDTVFLKNLGFKDTQKINSINIMPIIDIYKFVGNDDQRLELVKLLSEDTGLTKTVENELTSKNYPFHSLKISSSKLATVDGLINPLMRFLNESEYYSKIKSESLKNIEIKTRENDSIIKQIDRLLNNFNKNSKGSNSSLVFYNENIQLNDIIKTKETLIKEQGNNRIQNITFDKVIKDVSSVINIKNVKSINGKLKFISPFLLIFIFIISSMLMNFYQKLKFKYNK